MNAASKARVAVAMSGGVDSSVAAALLHRQGYRVFGVTLRLAPELDAPPHHRPSAGSGHRPCCLTQDVNDAQQVCSLLGIPHYVLNFESLFAEHVIQPFYAEYARGRTPNPCLACNGEIKFRFLLNKVLALGADYLATGHYARIVRSADSDVSFGDAAAGEYRLLQGSDSHKDQSYVLYMLGQPELRHLLFPLGGYTKSQVRRQAANWGLPVSAKPDSQEICFLPFGLLRAPPGSWGHPGGEPDTLASPGEIVDSCGQVLGRHRGIAFYTVGQRRGLGISSPQPQYVLEIDAAANRLVVGPEEALYSDCLQATAVSWVSGQAPPPDTRLQAKIRYRSPESPATLWANGDKTEVLFDQPQRAIAPGQAVVFYRGEVVLGGGIIDSVSRNGLQEILNGCRAIPQV